MAGNTITLTLAGDATSLQRAAAQSQSALSDVAESVTESNRAMGDAGEQASSFGDRMGKLGAATEGMTGAMDSLASGVQAFADIQSMAADKAQRTARALNDVKQAQEDYNQAILDGRQGALDVQQAEIDKEQALVDAAEAQKALTEAEREHGKGSSEARQAAVDLRQANLDLAQAGYDVDQALADQRQATIDATGAQLDLVDAQKEADPSGLQEFANTVNMLMPIMTGLISVVALVTAAQWAWNIAMTANPIGLVVAAIALIVGGIILLATQTDWLGKAWDAVWAGILWYINWVKENYLTAFRLMGAAGDWLIDKVTAIPGLIKSAFSGLANIITAPFRAGFNAVSDAWNNTIGRLSWTVPGWVPGLGGKSISAPRLPKFHDGGVVPGLPGSEMLAILQAGETVTPAGESPRTVIELRTDGTALGDALVEVLAGSIRRAGGVEVVFANG